MLYRSSFSAVAPFQVGYEGVLFDTLKSSLRSTFLSPAFTDNLETKMNALLSSSTSRRLLSIISIFNISIIDPLETIFETKMPSSSPTTIIITTENTQDAQMEDDTTNNHALLDQAFQYAFIFLIVVFVIIIGLAQIYAQFIYINHFFRVTALITAAVHIMDMLSDVFFTINASYGHQQLEVLIICILSGCFILIPIVMTLVQLCLQMEKHWLKDDKLRSWLSENTKLLYFTSIVTGSSFTAIELFNSNLFGLPQFDMGLTRKELMGYQYKRVYSVVLLENTPQLILQISYIVATNGAWGLITATSLAFTCISIIVAVISMFVQKQILFNQDLVMIEFDVTGASLVAKGDQCRNIIKKLHDQLATILGLSKGLVEVIRPNNIPNGLRVHLNIHIVDEDNQGQNIIDRFENILNEAVQTGQLQSTLKSCWKLDQLPTVSNLSVSTKDSKKKERLHTNEMHDGPDLEMNKLETHINNNDTGNSNEFEGDDEQFVEGGDITSQPGSIVAVASASENANLMDDELDDGNNDTAPVPYED